MKKLTSVLLIILAVSAFKAAAQQSRVTLSGFVREAGTGEPMPGAVITAGGKGTTTNNSGYYSLRLEKGEYSAECSFLGFHTESKTIALDKDTLLNFELSQQDVTINDIVVTASADVPPGSTFGKIDVNMQQLRFMPLFLGEQDIFKYFQIIPGVTGGKEGSSELNIRGGSSDQTLILLDDVPIYNPNHAMGFVSIFSGDVLGSAELYKGGLPATLGGRLSGVASMQTRNGNRQEHKQSLTIGLLTAAMTAEGPINKGRGSYIVSGRYFVPHALLNAAYLFIDDMEAQLSYLFYDFTGKVTYDLNDRNTLSWSLYTGKDAIDIRLKEELSYYDWETQENVKTKWSAKAGYNWGVLTSALKLNTAMNNGAFLNTTLYYSMLRNNTHSKYEDHFYKLKATSVTKSSLDEFGLKSVASHSLGAHDLKYGLHATYQNVRPKEMTTRRMDREDKVRYGNMHLLTAAFFADGNAKAGKFGFHYGLRVPVYYNGSKAAAGIEPRLGVSYDHNAKNSFYLSYDRNTQPLFTLGRQFSGMPMDFWVPYRDNKVQTSDQVSAGWKYKPLPELLISVEAFAKRMNNLVVVSDEDDMLAGYGGYEHGKGIAYGGELIAQYTGKKFSAMLSYAQTRSLRKTDGDWHDFIYDVPFNLNFFAKYETLRRGAKIHYASVNVGFRSGLPYTLSNELYPSIAIDTGRYYYHDSNIAYSPGYPNTRLSNYFRTDLSYSMEKQLKNGRRVWQFSILNATNYFNPFIVYPKDNKYEAMSLVPFLPSFSYKRYW